MDFSEASISSIDKAYPIEAQWAISLGRGTLREKLPQHFAMTQRDFHAKRLPNRVDRKEESRMHMILTVACGMLVACASIAQADCKAEVDEAFSKLRGGKSSGSKRRSSTSSKAR